MARRQAEPGNEPGPDHEEEGPSRSARKRQDLDLRRLGVELVELPPAVLDKLDLPEPVRDAVVACRSITAHGARLRQEMYIAKQLRRIDVEPLRETLARRADADRSRVRREHELERWRERLLADEAAAWTELAAQTGPEALPQLRSLVRQARAEQTASRPPAAARQLFRRLRELLQPAET